MGILKKGTILKLKGNKYNMQFSYVGYDEETNGHMLKSSMGDEIGPIGSRFLMDSYQHDRYNKKFQSFSDPSHGWVKVPKKMIERLGLKHKISSCSYHRGQFIYLEEDSDYTAFYDAYTAFYDHKPLTESNSIAFDRQSKIRGYESYNNLT